MTHSTFDLLARPIQHVLWDMHWESLRRIQVDAIRLLLTTDHDLLISARTASGKTEAAFLPVLSRLFEQPGESVGAMYIGPLKALINDQFRRLEDLCARAEIPVYRWHGDVDFGKKDKLLQQPRGVLLITPESLESFFVNRSSSIGRVFRDLRFVVIDEIHSLVGRERGLQLRSQLFRLGRYVQRDFRMVGLSATIGEAIDQYQLWIRPKNPDNVVHVNDKGEQKRVLFGIQTYETLHSDTESQDASRGDEVEIEQQVPAPLVADILRVFGGKKNLIFCNSRGKVEWLADSLNDACRRVGRPAEFLVHHGSVSKEIRLYTEQEMRGPRPATAVCSATLELGIDIGSVATVGQIGSCLSVNSQVQRMGRSGRRDNEPHCMRVMLPLSRQPPNADLVYRLYPDLLQAIAITELMLQRWVEPSVIGQFDLSTFVQQILSVLAEHGGILAKPLYMRLVEGAFGNIDQRVFGEVLRCLGQQQLIEQMDDGLLLLSPRGEAVVHDRDFYSAFATPQELVVRHDGRTIGSLSALYLPQPGDHFLLGGRRWQTIEVDVGRGEILVKPATGKKPPKFTADRERDIHPRIREEMNKVLCGESEFNYLDDTGKYFLADARTAYRNAGLIQCPVLALAANTCLWFTWTGTSVQRTLMLMADRAGLRAVDAGIAIQLAGPTHEVVSALAAEAGRLTSADDLVADLPMFGWRKFDCHLSEELLRQSYATDMLDLEGARSKIEELHCQCDGIKSIR